jgi:Amt family ammonium transporter
MPSDQTLWALISTAFVVLTIPGVALFYGGMVRKKNVLNTIALPLGAFALVSLEGILLGGTAIFGRGADVAANRTAGEGTVLLIPHAVTASLTLALIAGGIIERIRFSFFLLFGLFWIVLVYGPLSHWFWGGGWLGHLGALDFAGGAVIHISAGVTALVIAIMVGPRLGYGRTEMIPNHLPLSCCGAALMWVGWFGFSAGRAQSAMTTATIAFVSIQLSAATAALTWMTAEWLQRDKPTVLGLVSGAVAGLVAIAPAAGYVSPVSAVVIGVGAGGLCYMVVNYVKLILGYDDSLDVFGMHGVGGTWGMIATGLFVSTDVNPDGSDGLFYGYPYQFFVQVLAALVAWVVAGGMTGLLMVVLRRVLAPRVDQQAEMMGLDLALHQEKG